MHESTRIPGLSWRQALIPLVLMQAAMDATAGNIAATDSLMIGNVVIISAGNDLDAEPSDVLIEDGRIVAIGAIDEGRSAQFIDGTGKFLIPGLIDSHAHITTVPGLGFGNFGPISTLPALRESYERQQPLSFLYFGVTTVIDPVTFSAGAVDAFRSVDPHPDLYYCGGAPVAFGYPVVFQQGDLSGFPYFVIDPEQADRVPAKYDASQHTPAAVVRRMHEDGASCVKIFIEDGFGSASGWPILSDRQIRQIRDAAHDLGMPLLAHANALDMQTIALRNQVDVIAHGLWNWNPQDGAEGLPAPVSLYLDELLGSDVAFQPTMRVMYGIQGLFVPSVLDDPMLAKVAPPDLLAWLRTEDAGWFREELRADDFDGVTDEVAAGYAGTGISQGERVVAYLAKRGKPLLLASDFPASPTYVNMPGYSTFQELRHMAEAGVPLQALFEAATINNARAFGLDDVGSVATGKTANLLLLDANPLDDVDAYQRIDTVILHGRPIARETLAADVQGDNLLQ